MKIFSSTDNNTNDNTSTSAISSIIGQDMAIVGDITFKSKIQLDGNLEGNVSGTNLVLSESGKIKGDVEAETVVCYGKIDGNVKVDKLFLKKTGVINGRVDTSDLSVESGGILNGEIKSQTQKRDLQESPTKTRSEEKSKALGSPVLAEPQKV